MGPRTCAPVRFAVFTISLRGVVENTVIEGFEPYTDVLALHDLSPNGSSLSPSDYFNDLGDDAGADGTAAFADGEAQLLFHRDRHDQLDLDRHVVARHHHLGAFRQLHDPRHVRRPEIELRTVVAKNGV